MKQPVMLYSSPRCRGCTSQDEGYAVVPAVKSHPFYIMLHTHAGSMLHIPNPTSAKLFTESDSFTLQTLQPGA